ncbi:MAG: prolyl oligopeptidase family serine peptidase [Firmicutes bacterium]|nr:prolyl oligopeptidase family serine peptidase [Bacillota bacterium]
MNTKPAHRLAFSAVGAALVAVATMLIQIPMPAGQGYANVGDAAIFALAALFGPLVGAAAGGIGSALADLISGYGVWAPFTLIIKGVEGWLAGRLVHGAFKERGVSGPVLGGFALAALWMVAGYFASGAALAGNLAAAFAGIPLNIFQGAMGVAGATALLYAVRVAVRGTTGSRNTSHTLFVCLAAAWLAAVAGTGPAYGASEPVPLIPRQVLFGDPDRAAVRLSPDGTRISYLAPYEGVLNVWVAPVDDLSAARPVTSDRGRGVLNYGWTYLNTHIVYVQDTDGDENWKLYSVNVKTGETKLLTPEAGVQATLVATSPRRPEEIVVGLNDRIPQLHDLYLINLVSGQRQLLHQNEGMLGYLLDDDYNVRFGIAPAPDGGLSIFAAAPEGWRPFVQVSMEDAMTTAPVGLDATGTKLYMIDSRGRNTAALTVVDLETGAAEVLFADPRADVSHAIVDPADRTILAAASTYERRKWRALDPAVAQDMAYLSELADGEWDVVSQTLDNRRWVVAYIMDNGPVRYYLYDRDRGEAAFLFTNRSALEQYTLARMHPVIIPSRDGLSLVSYLTLPPWHEPAEGYVPGTPLPLVLEVHGGPWSRDMWGYNPIHQWLANRGYAVLSVNFRGSLGFGKAFLNAGNREWGGRMHDDLVDAVRWAIDQGIAAPDKICISGGSYGGYAALVGLTFTPDVFACGVSIVGPSNLVTLLESIPPYWEPQVEMFATRVGDHRTPEGRAFLAERSPLSYADRIRRPLLIGQGQNDPRVKPAESEQIVSAMQAANIPVTYVVYPDEGHGFVRPENRISFYAVQEAFFHQTLGGRLEPFGADFAGSSITVPVGAEEIDGLAEALDAAGE